ncbi:helix-turn-helix domain-containing protein [Aquiflexum sp.]|uniref:helix-turn-helix domain-containing protein n=1 Tax=Aquiflexum sp. TaxID=1872584 RepID=UPI00359324A8
MKKLLQPAGLGILSMILMMAILWPWNSNDFGENREIRLRNVGHKILLASGDTTSRVLPINKISEGEFIILFESPFQFEPNTLVKVIHAGLKEGIDGKENYRVNVLQCVGNQIVYGYQMSGHKDKTIVPCQGRIQPLDCYRIKIQFEPNQLKASNFSIPIFIGLLAFGFLFLFKKNPSKPEKEQDLDQSPSLFIGKYDFKYESYLLKIGSEEIELSQKENKLLKLFASHQNQILERDRLLKEIWEDEGVFVGRSLDMFVSKLRKKLILDSSINLKNIRGRGYMLQVD